LKHFTNADFWHLFDRFPAEIQKLVRQNYELLKEHPHPSVHADRFVVNG
jgi:hypothetical protein